jgi:hypothetical protein
MISNTDSGIIASWEETRRGNLLKDNGHGIKENQHLK